MIWLIPLLGPFGNPTPKNVELKKIVFTLFVGVWLKLLSLSNIIVAVIVTNFEVYAENFPFLRTIKSRLSYSVPYFTSAPVLSKQSHPKLFEIYETI